VRKTGGAGGSPRPWFQTWLNPNNSKWLIRKVLIRTIAQPRPNRAQSA
jgi:hypothetical protein